MKDPLVQICPSIKESTLKLVDEQRGDIPRSSFCRKFIFEEWEKNIKQIKASVEV